MKIRSFWKIYHANKIFLENLPFIGNISTEIDTNGKFPCVYVLYMPIEIMANQVKIGPVFNIHSGQWVIEWLLVMHRVGSSNPAENFYQFSC
jgi:hypothetical protein